MKASFICVETKSEITHAAITCKELKIPLALGCTDIRQMLNN
jgi:phosphohistidine swiveling domain-containing protein